MNHGNTLTIEPGKRNGKRCIRRTKIAVYEVLECPAAGMSQSKVIEDFTSLTVGDIRVCLSYAAD